MNYLNCVADWYKFLLVLELIQWYPNNNDVTAGRKLKKEETQHNFLFFSIFLFFHIYLFFSFLVPSSSIRCSSPPWYSCCSCYFFDILILFFSCSLPSWHPSSLKILVLVRVRVLMLLVLVVFYFLVLYVLVHVLIFLCHLILFIFCINNCYRDVTVCYIWLS